MKHFLLPIFPIFFYLLIQLPAIACDFSGNKQLNPGYRQLRDGEFQFYIADIVPTEKNLSDAVPTDGQTPYYIYLWDFGDCSIPSTQNTPLHRYEHAGTYTVKLTVKPIGATDSQTMTCTMNITTTTNDTFACETYTPLYTLGLNELVKLSPLPLLNSEGNLSNLPPLPPEAGQFVLYAVHVKGGGINTTPKITFQFPTEALEFSVAYNTPSCSGCNFAAFDGYTQSGSTAQVAYQLASDIPVGEQRSVYITLLVKPTVTAKTKIYCTATLDYQTGSSTPYLFQDDALSASIAAQADNSKWVDKDSICSNGNEWLTYKIKFKNNSTQTAQHIYIADSLPNYLDLSQVELLEVYPHQLPATRYHNYTSCRLDNSSNTSVVFNTNNAFMSVDAVNRRITWELRDLFLAGAGSAEAAANPDLSEGYLIYRVKVGNAALIPFNLPLQSSANICFDGQWNTSTNTCTTYRSSPAICYCNIQSQPTNSSWIKKVRLYRIYGYPTSTTTYYIDSQSGDNNGYVIFPNNPPTIYKNTSYHLELTPEAAGGSSGGNNFSWKAWLDTDNNGLFDPINEQFLSTSCSSSTFDFAFTLPTEIPTGITRLRIAMERGCDNSIDVCSGSNAAEIEDYILNIGNYGQPDLSVSIPAAADTIFTQPNSNETLQYYLRNIGSSPAYTGTIDTYYLSDNPVFDANDTFFGQYAVGINIIENDQITVSQPFVTPDTLTNGVYYLFIRTDSDNLDIESAEYNNYNRVVLVVCQNQNTCRVQNPVKVFLQAAFNSNSGQLNTTLAANQWLAPQQPYFGRPHYYGGNENTANISNLPSSDICDWVLVELRSSGNPALVHAQKAALLHSSGQVTDVGSNTLTLNADAGSYYIVVYHRNHLGIMSASPVSLSATTTAVHNFTDTPFKVFGSSSQTATLGAAKYGMLAGDINQDGIISRDDSNEWILSNGHNNAYLSADLNMDGIVNNSDFSLFRPNTYRLSPYFLRK